MAIVRVILPFKIVSGIVFGVVDRVYRIAVKIDTWWIHHVVGVEFELEDESKYLEQLNWRDAPVVICNHQSWFDIFILQALITGEGPIIKFLVKKELLWMPVVGWICVVLNFPSLQRGGDKDSRSRDLSVVRSASAKLEQEAGALLVFPEGTRFSQHKRIAQQVKFQHLLAPKQGGLSAIKASVSPDTTVMDISIHYNKGDNDCWRCLGGLVKKAHIRIDQFTMDDVGDTGEWLQNRWLEKDRWLLSKSL
jgi:1-acyl-sn-glycerol-3-phosphate acyltransferase